MEPHAGIEYKDFLREICVKREVINYLEIGVQNGYNLSQMIVPSVTGVDPEFCLTADITQNKESINLYRVTSDCYFRHHAQKAREAGGFDFSFLDGMHLFEYLLRDFYNTESISNASGIIAMHDCLPFDGEMIRRDWTAPNLLPGPHSTFWTGDVWKVILILQKYRKDLRVDLIDCAPTGLVVVSNLSPDNTILRDNYYEIVNEFAIWPNDFDALKVFYGSQEIKNSYLILSNYDHTLHFNL